MALSKRRKAEIKIAQDEVMNHSEMVRLLVEGKKVEVSIGISLKVVDPTQQDTWRSHNFEIISLLTKTENIADIRVPYILRQIRSWLNRKSGQKSRHTKNE